MGVFGEIFPGRKLKNEGDQGSPGREHDPGGPLDLERGVVYLAPPAEQGADRQGTEPSAENPSGDGSAENGGAAGSDAG
jgi:hypothetical protein